MKETETAVIMFMLVVDSYYVHEEDLGCSKIFSYHFKARKNFENKIQYLLSKGGKCDYTYTVSIWRNYFNHICFFIFLLW